MRRARWVLAVGLATLGCSTGEGTGWVKSERLYVAECWNGPFDLEPTFFGANPFRQQLDIRVQRGDNLEEVSDGLSVLVTDVAQIREEHLGEELRVTLPRGVSPPGVPVRPDADPAKVSLSLYLNDTCHQQNSSLYALDGTITFRALFSGDPNEKDGGERLTEARFGAFFADPRDQGADGVVPEAKRSWVEGGFRFFFQRGQPAQPFP